ncbi:MAG: vanadium-dependent haloperoxidase [Pseudomonadota bacterium]
MSQDEQSLSSERQTSETTPDIGRRRLLQGALLGATALGAGGLAGCDSGASASPAVGNPSPPVQPPISNTPGSTFGPLPAARADEAAQLKIAAAEANRAQHTASAQPNNGDEARYSNFIGSFSKTLAHNAIGEVNETSYLGYLDALESGDPDRFDAIIVGNPTLAGRIGLVSPQAAFSFETAGLDGQSPRLPNAPTFESAETAAEMTEIYWYALCRDVPFSRYDADPLIAAAVADLNALSRSDIFPGVSGAVTPQTIFRSALPGSTTGPLVSQFLLQPFFFGAFEIDGLYRRVAEGSVNDFMTSFDEYLAIQRGAPPVNPNVFDTTRTNLYSMRQLGEFVHVDNPVQSGLYAATILFELGAFDATLPLQDSAVEDGFVDFGKADITALVTRGPRHALTAAWYQKWLVHRRLRPENYAARINISRRALANYPIHPDVLNSDALARIDAAQSNADDRGLLPMGYPEGCPAHPAYPGGHSTFSAAAATMCKAFYDENFVFPNPVQPSADGLSLEPYTGPDLTVGGELNKLVGNITHGRDGAGMHWRSDGVGNFAGEEIAISILQDYSRTYNERFDGFRLTRFNGTPIRIVDGQVL